MTETKHLLIGGGLACSQAAKMIRMKDADAPVLLVSREPHLPYDRPPLSKEFLRGEKSKDELVYDAQSFFDEKNIEVVLSDPVVALDLSEKIATLGSGGTITFEKALIATGGKPIELNVPGNTLGGVYYLRSIDHASAIASQAAEGKTAVVVGAGFIGMEVAASLTQRGVKVIVIESMPQIWPRFLDPALARYIRNHCIENGIEFRMETTVKEFRGGDRISGVVTSGGEEIPCDFACIGIGIEPETRLAEDAGLKVKDGIVVNDFLQTSHADVYAAGDVVNYPDPVFRKRRRVEHWGHAEYCGQVAGLNMAGTRQKYDLLSYIWSDVFDLHIECAGDESDPDRIVIRGELSDPSFIVLYLKDKQLTAYFAVNAKSREYPKLQNLIRRRTDLTGKDAELRDPSFDLKELLA